jgi:hypothetical protein
MGEFHLKYAETKRGWAAGEDIYGPSPFGRVASLGMNDVNNAMRRVDLRSKLLFLTGNKAFSNRESQRAGNTGIGGLPPTWRG